MNSGNEDESCFIGVRHDPDCTHIRGYFNKGGLHGDIRHTLKEGGSYRGLSYAEFRQIKEGGYANEELSKAIEELKARLNKPCSGN